jgi:SAM-dependent methyltransferase
MSERSEPAAAPRCRFCATALRHVFVDLGMSPLCQRHVRPEELGQLERFYPLVAYVCEACFLVQLEEIVTPDAIFSSDYAYFSSYSDSWLEHARRYSEAMVQRFGLGPAHNVVEIASNDGYLLQNFRARGMRVLGIEPAANCAAEAERKGIPSLVRFFGRETARFVRESRGGADLMCGNNVLAHVPDINDFVAGIAILLAPSGVITLEFPHLMKLVEENQFDTIYHEHFSYLSFGTVERIFARHGLTLFDVEELPTHGGSLRIYARHADHAEQPVGPRVEALRRREEQAGMRDLAYYRRFGQQVAATKRKLLRFLCDAKDAGKTVVGYGAPGKGNTLLNYCGIRTDFLDFTVDRSPHKQGNYLPGTRIPICAPEKIREARPDYVLILPWNLQDEIVKQMHYIREWGGRFVVPIPEVKVLA